MIRSIPTGVTNHSKARTDGVSSCDLLDVKDCIACPNDLPLRWLAPKPPTRPLRRPPWPWQGTLRPRRSNGDVHALHGPPQASQPPLALPSRSSIRGSRLNLPALDRTFHLALHRPAPRRAYPPLKPALSEPPKRQVRRAFTCCELLTWEVLGSHAPPLATSIAEKYVAQARPPRPGV